MKCLEQLQALSKCLVKVCFCYYCFCNATNREMRPKEKETFPSGLLAEQDGGEENRAMTLLSAAPPHWGGHGLKVALHAWPGSYNEYNV